MVDGHAISFVIKETREQDCPPVDCRDWRSTGHAIIEAKVRTLGDAVEDALRTEHVGRCRIDGREKVAMPFAFRGQAAQVILFYFYAFGYLRLLFGIRLGELFLNRQL